MNLRKPDIDAVESVPMLIDGKWRPSASDYEVADPYRGTLVARAPRSTRADVDAAVAAAAAAKREAASVPGFQRAALLRRAGDLAAERREELAGAITRETGKALKDARAEVDRSLDTIALSAEEAIRIEGEHVPLEGTTAGAGKLALLLRFPVGVVAAITPFNAPINLATHKIAPALAAGNTVVIKPPPQAPLSVHKLIKVFVDAGTPAGFLNAVYGEEAGSFLIRHPAVDFISFTGSTRVGAEIRAAAGLRRVALELGGTGQTIVHDDGDLDAAAPLCARNAMRLAGQSCISVQNLYVHARVFEPFVERLRDEILKLNVGDPLDPETDVGVLIDEAAARRVESWVMEAVAQGARIVTGGRRRGAQLEPTLLAGVTSGMKVVCNEVFGPVLSVQPYDDLELVIAAISERALGLQCGIFTRSLGTAFHAARNLRTGGVIINGTSTWRTDQMPYGGVKGSGMGREGPRYAIRDMTEERLIVFAG